MSNDYSGHVPQKSRTQQVIDDILVKQDEARQQVFDNLMVKPGVLAAFGDDFTVEFGDVEFSLEEGFRNMDEVKVTFRQTMTFRRPRPDNVTPIR